MNIAYWARVVECRRQHPLAKPLNPSEMATVIWDCAVHRFTILTGKFTVWLPATCADVPRTNVLDSYDRHADEEVEDCIVELCSGSTLLQFHL